MVKLIIRWLAVLLLFITAFLVFILTPLGAKTALALVRAWIPGQLHYQKFSGTLIGPLSIDQLDYQHGQLHLTIGHLELKWNPIALLDKTVFIKHLVIQQMDLITPSSSKTSPQHGFHLPQLRPLQLPFAVTIKDSSLENIRWGHSPGQWLINLQQAGIQGSAANQQMDFQINAKLKQPDLTAHLFVFGPLTHYHFELTLQAFDTHWMMVGHGTQQSIRFLTAKSQIFGGTLSGELALNWANQWNWQLQLAAKQLNLRTLNPDWPQKVDANVQSSGTLIHDQPQFSWNLDLNTSKNHIHTEGRRQNDWQVKWNINAQQTGELISDTGGKLQSQGTLAGNWPTFTTKGQLSAQDLHWQNNVAHQIQGQWQLDLSQQQSSSLQMMGQQIQLFDRPIKTFNLNAAGTLKQHQIRFSLADPISQINTQVNGTWQNNTWYAELQKVQLQSIALGNWQQQQITSLIVNARSIHLKPLCLMSTLKEQFCINIDKQDAAWHSTISAAFNLQRFNSSLPADWQIQAPVTLKVEASGKDKQVQTLVGQGLIKSGRLLLVTNNQQATLPIQGGELNLNLNQQQAAGQLQFRINNRNGIQAQFKLPNFTQQNLLNKHQAIAGAINVQLQDAKIIDNLIPHVSIIDGQLLGKFVVAGTVQQPQITGNLNLAQGKVNIPQFNISLNNFKVTTASEKSVLNFHATALTENRPIQADGKIDFSKPHIPIDIDIKGNDILAVNTSEYVVYATTSNLHINVQGFQVTLTGQVLIPKATIQPVDIKGVVTLPENDVVILGGSPLNKKSPWEFTIRVDAVAGDNITINAMGLTSKLAGKVSIVRDPEQAPLGNGRITLVNGSYEVLGRPLTIAPNSEIFYRLNPLDNPNLNIQVYTMATVSSTGGQEFEMNNVKVVANIGGTASSPQLSFFSNPAILSQNDIISYLVLGTPGGTTSPQAAGALLQALDIVRRGNKQSTPNQLSAAIKRGLGFSELGVETESALAPLGEPTLKQTTYVVLGKRITPRLSAVYKIDPVSSVSIFTLFYTLTSHIRLQSEKSNLGTGADILYTIDKKYKPKPGEKCE